MAPDARRYRAVAPGHPGRLLAGRPAVAPTSGPTPSPGPVPRTFPPRADRSRLGLLLYVAGVLLATHIHQPLALAAGLLGVLLLAGRSAPALLRRAVKTVLYFNLAVSLGYLALALHQGQSPGPTLLLINLRVLLLTCMTFLFMARVNLFLALGFSRDLTYLLGLAYSQALAFRRAHDDFRLALASRSIVRPGLADRYRASAAAASWFIDKGLGVARDSAQALRSRGFYD